MFAAMFAGQCLPMRSNGVPKSQCGSTKRGASTRPPVLKVRCSSRRLMINRSGVFMPPRFSLPLYGLGWARLGRVWACLRRQSTASEGFKSDTLPGCRCPRNRVTARLYG